MPRVGVIDTSTFINLSHINRHDLLDKLKFYIATTVYVENEIRDRATEKVRSKFNSLKTRELIKHVELTVENLIEMARVPESKRISNAELSCLVKAKEFQGVTLCDDRTANKFATKFIELPEVIGIDRLIIEAFCESILSDGEVGDYQKVLANNRCKFRFDLQKIASEERAKRVYSGN